jgi:hypothetical protein
MKLESESQCLIKGYLPKDTAQALAEYLKQTYSLIRFSFSHARGDSMHSKGLGFAQYEEKDIIEIVLEEALADQVFEDLYFRLNMDDQPGSVLIQLPLNRVSVFCLPENLPEQAG